MPILPTPIRCGQPIRCSRGFAFEITLFLISEVVSQFMNGEYQHQTQLFVGEYLSSMHTKVRPKYSREFPLCSSFSYPNNAPKDRSRTSIVQHEEVSLCWPGQIRGFVSHVLISSSVFRLCSSHSKVPFSLT